MRSPATRIACLALTLTAAASAAAAQTPTSGQLAKQLVTSLTGSGLAAIAARDPGAPDRAVAALAFPDSQLLVVAAPYPDAAGLDALLAHRMYRDVYTTLQQPSFNQGKVFIQDLGCDGLQSGPESVDVMYEDGKTQTIFDGNWKRQKLSESEYQQRVKKAEERYARLLSVLIEQARSGTK
jgi:hypothetical protein